MDPFQAARAVRLLSPKKVIPMHFKTFPILVQDASGFIDLVGKEAPGVEIVSLNPGEEYLYSK
jgi:L-ascorbate metabolism protein UlaG (beta-lactamase superfamily)